MIMLRRPFLLLLALASLGGVPAAARQKAEPPLITVTGQAEVKVAPDEVLFTLEVRKTDKELMAAKNQNDAVVRQVLELARAHGISPQDVQTDHISVAPKYRTEEGEEGDEESAKSVFVGYEVSKTIVVRLRDISKFETLLSDVLKTGVERVRNVEFRSTQMRKFKDQARALAVRAARQKAAALTGEIGQTIGKAHSMSEEGEGRSAMSNYSTVISGSYSDDENSTIAPGMITVTARVTVSFLLL